MNIINFLCVDGKDKLENLWLMILPLIGFILLVCGVVLICKYYCRKNQKEKKRFKLGWLFFVLFIGVMALSVFVMASNSTSLVDACNSIHPIYALIKSLFSVSRLIIPFILIVEAMISAIRILFAKNDSIKKELKTKIGAYIIMALLVFLVMTIVSIFFGMYIKVPKSQWSVCWC